MLLIALADAVQDGNGFLRRGLVHGDGLEAPLEGGIAFNVLAVLIKRGGANHLHLAARQRRLEDVGGIHGGTRSASAHQHVHFINEQDCAGLLDLVDHTLEALLKLPAIHGAGHQRAHIQLQDALAQQQFGHIAVDDALRQAFHNCSLAHARLANQCRVVLGAPRQNLNHTLHFCNPPDDRIQFALLGQCRQVGGQLV